MQWKRVTACFCAVLLSCSFMTALAEELPDGQEVEIQPEMQQEEMPDSTTDYDSGGDWAEPAPAEPEDALDDGYRESEFENENQQEIPDVPSDDAPSDDVPPDDISSDDAASDTEVSDTESEVDETEPETPNDSSQETEDETDIDTPSDADTPAEDTSPDDEDELTDPTPPRQEIIVRFGEYPLWEYQDVMYIGESQLLFPEIIPNQDYEVYSENPGVLEVITDLHLDEKLFEEEEYQNMRGRKPFMLVAHSGGSCDIVFQFGEDEVRIPFYVYALLKGSYSSIMEPGETQVLEPYYYPDDRFCYVDFASRNDVLSVDAGGTVYAVSPGHGTISITDGSQSAEYAITVRGMQTGTYDAYMLLNSTQTLLPICYALETDDVSYISDNEDILKTDGNIVTAVGIGTAQITAIAEGYSAVYTITAASAVTDIDPGDYSSTMTVGTTQMLSPTALPLNVTESGFTYFSEDDSVLTVNALGRVRAIAEGTTRIGITCDGFTYYCNITAQKAESPASYSGGSSSSNAQITVKNAYVILKPGETHTISAKVSPSWVSKRFTYSSANTEVATVSTDGVITAVKSGTATILVTNGSQTAVVSVIVNLNPEMPKETIPPTEPAEEPGANDPFYGITNQNSTESIYYVDGNEVSEISKQMLESLFGTDTTLEVAFEGYLLSINGKDIRNVNNTVRTEIPFFRTALGTEFILNNQYNLPGKITVSLLRREVDFKYLYLYNEYTGKWQQLNGLVNNTFSLDTAGHYLLTMKKQQEGPINWLVVAGAAGLVIVAGGVYIYQKKKYWFW